MMYDNVGDDNLSKYTLTFKVIYVATVDNFRLSSLN